MRLAATYLHATKRGGLGGLLRGVERLCATCGTWYALGAIRTMGWTNMMTESVSHDDLIVIRRLARCIDTFRGVEPRMPMSYAATFLAVAMKPGLGPTEYAKMLGTIQPIASRMLLEIGKRSRTGGEGLGLVQSETTLKDLRTSAYSLTPKGRILLNQLVNTLRVQ